MKIGVPRRFGGDQRRIVILNAVKNLAGVHCILMINVEGVELRSTGQCDSMSIRGAFVILNAVKNLSESQRCVRRIPLRCYTLFNTTRYQCVAARTMSLLPQ
jgi:hypothetical protein